MVNSLLMAGRSTYHFLWAFFSSLWYGAPGNSLVVIGVTGTKGKTTVSELIAAILETAGHKVAVSSTIHFSIAGKEERNYTKMTMPGRSFIQKFLARARAAQCTHAVIEVSSEGARQHRHRFIPFDAVVVTNISPEHIESHGSYEAYLAAKLSIARALLHSTKKDRVLVVNNDDAEKEAFLSLGAPQSVTFSTRDPFPYHTSLPGEMNKMNILAAAATTRALGVPESAIARAVREFSKIRGRMEPVENTRGITIFVDYAHTKESLEAAYKAAGPAPKVCVLGSCGGGRDKWKRPLMAEVAHNYCREIILTNEDPYDEDPRAIIRDMEQALPAGSYTVEMDRRAAIRLALQKARPGEILMITGKGTDPFICGPAGSKIPWDDTAVVREELKKLSHE